MLGKGHVLVLWLTRTERVLELDIHEPVIPQSTSEKRKRQILLAIGGTWGVAVGYLIIYLLLVHTGVGMSLIFNLHFRDWHLRESRFN